MVELEILTSNQRDEPEWFPLARLRVSGHEIEVEGEEQAIDFNIPVVSLRTGGQVLFDADPEEWARSLPTAFRTGDIIVRVLHDDDPLRADELPTFEVERHEVQLREHVEHQEHLGEQMGHRV